LKTDAMFQFNIDLPKVAMIGCRPWLPNLFASRSRCFSGGRCTYGNRGQIRHRHNSHRFFDRQRSCAIRFGCKPQQSRRQYNRRKFLRRNTREKRLGLLSELVPSARVFGILINPANDNAENQLKDVAQGTLALRRPAVTLKASNDSEIDAAFDAFSQQNVNAVLVASDPFFNGRRQKIAGLAARYNLPSISEWREFVQAGGLASYGSNLSDNYRLGGVQVGRVLKGEKPANLPVVQATQFEFVINLKTAKSLGLTLPSGVLSIADAVIE
jgi:hypothetical protein